MAKEDLQEHLPYQVAAHVRQLLAARADAAAIGLISQVERCDKELRNLGWKTPEKAPEVRRDAPPEGREAPAERVVTAEKGAPRPRPRAAG